MKNFLKRATAIFLSFLVLLSSFSLPTVTSVLADEIPTEAATEYVEETTAPEVPTETMAPSEEPVVDVPQETFDAPAEDFHDDIVDVQTEETTEEETTEAETEEVSSEMPANTLTGMANGITVIASFEEDTFPKGTMMVVTTIPTAKIYDVVNEAVKGDVTQLKAVDISFCGPKGEPLQPQKPVKITMNAPGMTQGEIKNVVHIDDNNKAEAVQDVSFSGDNSIFDASSFSGYGIVLSTLNATDDALTEEETTEGDTKAGDDAETWTVSFYDRDAELYQTVNVVKGKAIGEQLPETIAREDYIAYWAIGTIVEGDQGTEIGEIGKRIDSTFVPTENTTIVPDYDQISYTVSFYDSDADDAKVIATKTVNSNTSYCLNEIPAVPTKDGYTGKWVYGDGSEFTNQVKVTADTKVWAKYDKNVFTVTYMVGEEAYEVDEYYKGDNLTLPADPVAEGQEFVGWFSGETQYTGGEAVNSDLTLTAQFKTQYSVSFIVLDDAGQTIDSLTQYFKVEENEKIGNMPQNPFVAGKVFEKWVNRDTGETVTADTVVTGNITAVAQFRTVTIYNITVEYYYLNDNKEEVIFNTDLIQEEAHSFPYTITAPASTKTDSSQVEGGPDYYPEKPSQTVELKEGTTDYKVRFKYVPYTAEYDFVYLLKDLEGEGYTEIGREKDVQGVLGSYVTPAVKDYDYAVLERAEGAEIKQAKGQELNVYYTRRNFSLSYETNGGSYVAGTTVPYGTSVELPATNPTRNGYTFEGWYSDAELTHRVTGSVTVHSNTTLYAKWTGNRVNYTIIYMKEQYNASGNTWVYESSAVGTGIVTFITIK